MKLVIDRNLCSPITSFLLNDIPSDSFHDIKAGQYLELNVLIPNLVLHNSDLRSIFGTFVQVPQKQRFFPTTTEVAWDSIISHERSMLFLRLIQYTQAEGKYCVEVALEGNGVPSV